MRKLYITLLATVMLGGSMSTWAVNGQQLSGANATSTTVTSGKNMWGWNNGQTCNAKKDEIQWDNTAKTWKCVTNVKIVNVN